MNTERPDIPDDGTDPAPGDAGRAAPDASDGSSDGPAAGEATGASESRTSATEATEAAEAVGSDAVTATAAGPDAGTAGAEAGEGARGRRRSRLVAAAVAAAVLAVGGGGAYLTATATGGSGGPARGAASGAGATPPPLVLDDLPARSTNGIAPGEPDPHGTTYRAAGALPDGPGSASVYRPASEVGRAEVTRLAHALGIEGTPVADGQVWRVGSEKDGTSPVLRVNRQAPGSWTFERYAPGTDDCRKAAVCAHGADGGTDDPVDAATARKAAAPVLAALGQSDARIGTGQVMGARRTVTADPVVGGLPTQGWTTTLTVSGQGEPVSGDGLLKAPVRGDTYPVLDAEKTLALMNGAQGGAHRMGIGGCTTPVPPQDRLEQPCGTSPSVGGSGQAPTTGGSGQASSAGGSGQVSSAGAASGTGQGAASGAAARATGTVEEAVFGLASHSVGGRQTLVPSWLFQVRDAGAGDAFTVTYPALDPEYLASASAPAPAPTSAPGSRSRDVDVAGYAAEGRDLTVSFTGGVCADYTVSAHESGDRVKVTVTENPWPGRICILIAKEYGRTVRLDEPLGSRAVVGSDGEPVPRSGSVTHLPEPSARAR